MFMDNFFENLETYKLRKVYQVKWDWTKSEPEVNRKWTKMGPKVDWKWIRSEPEVNQNGPKGGLEVDPK